MPLANSSWIVALLAFFALAGCTADERLVAQAERASERQADQNRLVAVQSQQTAAATNKLVEADALGRKETLAMQHDLQAEQARLNQARDELESERRFREFREPVLATTLMDLALLLACILPLVLCWFVLGAARRETPDQALNELLIQDLAEASSDRQDRGMPGTRAVLADEPDHPRELDDFDSE